MPRLSDGINGDVRVRYGGTLHMLKFDLDPTVPRSREEIGEHPRAT